MLLILAVAGAAAALVVLHSRLRDSRPELATSASARVQQLAAVVLVLAKAAEGLVDALQAATRPRAATPSGSWRPQPRTLMDSWDVGYPDED